MKFSKKTIYAVMIVLLVLISTLTIVLLSSRNNKASYLTAPVTRADIAETVLASGTITPIKQVNVGAQVNGQLKSIKVKLGDQVKKGQLLAEIDPALQNYDLLRVQASLANIQAQKQAKLVQLKMYEATLKRQQIMIAAEATSHAELEQAQANVDNTQAEMLALTTQIDQALIEVDKAKVNLAYTQIVAPIDGEVISIVTEEGQTVVSAQSAPTILVLADLNTMTVKTQISEADVMRAHPGDLVHFTVLGMPNKKFLSTLRAIEPAPSSLLNQQSNVANATPSSSSTAVYYNGLFEIANSDRQLLPFMTAQVSIVLRAAENVLVIPVTALGEKTADNTYEVRVLDKNHQPQIRSIKTGINNYIHVQVLTGLNEGEQVILADSEQVSNESPSMFMF